MHRLHEGVESRGDHVAIGDEERSGVGHLVQRRRFEPRRPHLFPRRPVVQHLIGHVGLSAPAPARLSPAAPVLKCTNISADK